MSTYVVGDLQGCYTPLRQLLDVVSFDPAHDTLWLTGDLVNRGPESLACLRFVYGLGAAAITVLGNHDLHLLAVALGDKSPKRKDTLDDILMAPDRDALLQWLRHQPLMHVDEKRKLALVHAGIYPGWTLTQAHICAQEVEDVLQSDDCVAFFQEMYGNEPAVWCDTLEGMGRLRFITNAFTRMRICTSDHALEFAFKGAVQDVPVGYQPWFVQTQMPEGWRILFGHWAALQAHTGCSNMVALDSGCVWGNHLTMLRLDDEAVFRSI